MTQDDLPEIVREFARKFPQVWDAYNRLGESAAQSGPIDARTERLVKLALAIGARAEGGARSHVRRGLKAGLSRQEIEHVAILAITTIGWPNALAAFSWISDELEGEA